MNRIDQLMGRLVPYRMTPEAKITVSVEELQAYTLLAMAIVSGTDRRANGREHEVESEAIKTAMAYLTAELPL